MNLASLNITVRDSPIATKFMSSEELAAIAASLIVSLPPGAQLVHYGDTPPSNTSIPWQPTLNDGITPKSMVMRFVGGQWRVV